MPLVNGKESQEVTMIMIRYTPRPEPQPPERPPPEPEPEPVTELQLWIGADACADVVHAIIDYSDYAIDKKGFEKLKIYFSKPIFQWMHWPAASTVVASF